VIFAVVHTENWDVIRTYKSRSEAVEHLAAIVDEEPRLSEDVGIRPFDNGRPAGDFEPASEVLGERLTQHHLA
jgi:hypothetical protein